jgi:hypothetical protein
MHVTYEKRLNRYISNLISDKAIRRSNGYELSFNALDDEEQGYLTYLLIECDDRDVSECFCESYKQTLNDNITCSLLMLLQDNSEENKESLANLIRKNTLKKYINRIQSLIDQHCAEIFHSEMNDSGFYCHQHKDNGEIYWRKNP